MNNQYTWIPFYMEFADKLRIYSNDRSELIQMITDVYEKLGISLPTLEKAGMTPVDIDPFTVFGLFNKGIKDKTRIAICTALAEQLHINSDIPNDFNGIPILNNMRATFYYFIEDQGRGEQDIDNLWKVFIAALNYADEQSETNRSAFCEYYDIVSKQKGIRRNLTIGLFWIRPYHYLNLDSCNTDFLKSSNSIPYNVRKMISAYKGELPSSDAYLQICSVCKGALQTAGLFNSFPSMSYYAWSQNKTATGTEGTDWFPTLEEYNPGLSVEDWRALLANAEVFDENSLTVVQRIYEMGGTATCKELSDKYGDTPQHYNSIATSLAKRIIKVTKIPNYNVTESKYWPVLFVGKPEENKEIGTYRWKLRDELNTALEIFLNGNSIENIPATWLLNWNPNAGWDWEEQEDDHNFENTSRKVKSGGAVFFSWRCHSKQLKEGDRVFMIKLGPAPRGIFATGYVAGEPYETIETDENGQNAKNRWVDICITGFLDYHTEELISQDTLKKKFPEQQWSPQGSGISIKSEAARWLIDNWDSFQDNHNKESESDLGESENEPVIWKISHGTPSTSGISKELRKILEERKAVIVNKYTTASIGQKTSQGDDYMYNIKAGDYFYLCYAGEIALFAQFLDNSVKMNQEMFDEWENDGWQERKYRLIALSNNHSKYTGIKKLWTSNYNSTCVKVTDNILFEELILEPYFGLKLSDLQTGEYHEPYTKDDFLKDVFITESEYDKLRSLVLRKKNIILQGAPGVGKTYCAKRLAYSIIGEKNESRICVVQFHQNYSYEDFIMGYRPNESGGFELQIGVFYDFCIKCNENPDKRYFFIIDEINRGNLSKIFGELLMLIETDKRGEKHKINLVYGGKSFYIPENLHIIGMMNTADRSLAMIDYALRRRFSFYTMQPAFENKDKNGFGDYTRDISCELYHTVIAKIKDLNNAIRKDSTLGKGFEIGHSYFVPEESSVIDDEWVRNVVEFEIIPLIEEYWFDNDKMLGEWEKPLYKAVGEDYDG